MLSDIIEEEFDIKEEEPWYDHQDLEHDLHLAAELGKNLLERNRELEQRLQQMYTTNQEQLQQIEYLSKQVDLLRSVNDQHAKVYEQLDVTARDLEQKNQRLILENRVAQQKIEVLTETVDGLQIQVEELQREIKKLVSSEQKRANADAETPQPDFVKCQLHKYYHALSCSSTRSASKQEKQVEQEEERMALLRSVHSLQAQLSTERSLREAAEQEADALAHNLCELEPKLAMLGNYKDRLAEMEAEAEELRLILRSNTSVKAPCTHSLLPESVFLSSEDEVGVVRHRGRCLNRSISETQFHTYVCEEEKATERVHESGRALGQAEDVKHHGISLLNEVDAQYTALQEKYDTLLRSCDSGMVQQNHKAVQTHVASSAQTNTHIRVVSTQDDVPLPEYKALFHEIFSFIQKSKKDLKENRIKPGHVK